MNPLGYLNRKRKLPALLAALVLMQSLSLLGIPELSAATGADSAADPHHAGFFVEVDPASDCADRAIEADNCGGPSDPAECDHCCCCQGTHLSVLPDLVVMHDPPITNWLVPPGDRSPSRSTTMIHRPPIA